VKVYKYPLTFDDEQFVALPLDSEILTVAVQYGQPVLYVRVHAAETRTVNWRIETRGTGHPDANGAYIGTLMFQGGALVFHYFYAD
jgi:hypothetical protein